MINKTIQSTMTMQKHLPYCLRLKAAREALGMDRKEAAAQLRLSEQIIIMLENGEFKPDLPFTFIRGYIRSYSKLLSIPEHEVQEALEVLQPQPLPEEHGPTQVGAHSSLLYSGKDMALSLTMGDYFVKFFTYLIAITLLALVGIWWHGTMKTNTVTHMIVPVISTPANKPNTTFKPADTQARTVSSKAVPAIADRYYHSDKTRFTQFALNNNLIQLIASLILFLLILTISLRIYSSSPLAGSSRPAERRMTKPLFTDFSYSYFNVKKLILIFLVLFIIFAFLGSLRWYRHRYTQTVSSVLVQQLLTAPRKPPAPITTTALNDLDLGPLNADITVLAPLPQLQATLMAGFKVPLLQKMQDQLNQYIAQAAEFNSSLTGPYAPFGQIKKYKKKHRRKHYYYHRPAYLRYGENEVTPSPADNVIYP